MRDLWLTTLYESIPTCIHPHVSNGAVESDMLSACEVVLRSFGLNLCWSK